MAAAIIPLVASLAPSLISLIASLAHPAAQAAEAIGPGTGAVKFAQVLDTVMGALQTAAAAGTIPKDLPSDETIKVILQAVISTMQLSGLLGPGKVTTPAAGSPDGIILKAGQRVTISVAG